MKQISVTGFVLRFREYVGRNNSGGGLALIQYMECMLRVDVKNIHPDCDSLRCPLDDEMEQTVRSRTQEIKH